MQLSSKTLRGKLKTRRALRDKGVFDGLMITTVVSEQHFRTAGQFCGAGSRMEVLCENCGCVMLQEGCEEVCELVNGVLVAAGLRTGGVGRISDCRATQEEALSSNPVFSQIACVCWSK